MLTTSPTSPQLKLTDMSSQHPAKHRQLTKTRSRGKDAVASVAAALNIGEVPGIPCGMRPRVQ